jgi:hypothetical protein
MAQFDSALSLNTKLSMQISIVFWFFYLNPNLRKTVFKTKYTKRISKLQYINNMRLQKFKIYQSAMLHRHLI